MIFLSYLNPIVPWCYSNNIQLVHTDFQTLNNELVCFFQILSSISFFPGPFGSPSIIIQETQSIRTYFHTCIYFACLCSQCPFPASALLKFYPSLSPSQITRFSDILSFNPSITLPFFPIDLYWIISLLLHHNHLKEASLATCPAPSTILSFHKVNIWLSSHNFSCLASTTLEGIEGLPVCIPPKL